MTIPCRIGNQTQAKSLEIVVTNAGLTMTDWDDFVEVMQEGETDERANYLCWMKNHLSGCTTCPPCLKSDPFEEE